MMVEPVRDLSQIPFDLPWPRREGMARGDFIAQEEAGEALALLDRAEAWPDRRFAIAGPPSSGKTHLATIWARDTDAAFLDLMAFETGHVEAASDYPHLIVEDADRALAARGGVAETALFHLINAAQARGHWLLLSGREAPALWPVALPDLASRLSAFPTALLSPPSQEMLAALLFKLFDDREMKVEPKVVSYIAARIETRYDVAEQVVETLDGYNLLTARRVTLPLVREAMGWG